MISQLRKYQIKMELGLIKGLGKLLDSWLFFKSFSTAGSLEQYYNRGYWYGFFFLVFIGFLFLALDYSGLYLGFLTNRLADLPPNIKTYVKDSLSALHFSANIPGYFSSFPIYFLVPATYLLFNLFPPLKKKIGELFSRFFIFVFSKSIDAGEWFINRRWISLLSILILSICITSGLYYLIDKTINKRLLQNDLTRWFKITEEFIEKNSLSQNQHQRYVKEVQEHWNSNFEAFFTSPENKISSFTILNGLLKQLYGERDLNVEWFAHLKTIKMDDVENNKPNRRATVEELRAWCLVYILAGRIYNRKFEKEFNDFISNKSVSADSNLQVDSNSNTNSNSLVASNSNVKSNSAVNSNLNAKSNLNLNSNLNTKSNLNLNSNLNTKSNLNANSNLTANAASNLNSNSVVNSVPVNSTLNAEAVLPSPNPEILDYLKSAEKNFKEAKKTLELVEKKLKSDGKIPEWTEGNLESVDETLESSEESSSSSASSNPKNWIRSYRSSISNGFGNVYSNHFKYLVKKSNSSADNENVFEGCKYPRGCLSRSKKYFQAAAVKFPPCSYQSIRATNNIADLYMRAAQNYDLYANSLSLDENKKEMSRLELADSIDKEIRNLTECFGKSDPIPLILTTLAQASAESANLKISANLKRKETPAEDAEISALEIPAQEIARQVTYSANYLKIAYNFNNSSSILDWELEPFCKFISGSPAIAKMSQPEKDAYKEYQDIFTKILKASPGDLESPTVQLIRRIREAKLCQ